MLIFSKHGIICVPNASLSRLHFLLWRRPTQPTSAFDLSNKLWSFTWTEQLGVDRLVEDDHCGTQGWQRDVQAAASRRGLQLLGEVLQVSIWGVAEELEEIIVKTVSVGAVDDEVRDRKHFEQESSPLALFGAVSKQPFRVNDNHLVDGVKRCPHTHCAGLLCGRCLENFPAHEESVVQRVGFALSCVAKDGHDLQQLVRVATQEF